MKYFKSKIFSRFPTILRNLRRGDRDSNIRKNILISFLVKGISIATQLVLVPLTIGYINTSQYGIWLTLSSIVGWFSFFDMGFGNGLRNRFAEASASGNVEKARVYISTTYISLSLVFLTVWLCFSLLNLVLDWGKLLNAPSEMAEELSTVAIIIFTFFCLQIVLKTINTVLIADQKPAKSAFLDMISQVGALLIIYVLTKTTKGSLTYLALAVGVSPIIVLLIASIYLYGNKYKKYGPSMNLFDRSIVKDIMSLGSKFFLIQISAVIIFQTNNMVIAQICGNESVTVYNVVYKLFMVVYMIFQIILSPFWSAFTEAHTKGEFDWMKNIIVKLERMWILLSLGSIFLLIVSPLILNFWLDDKIIVPYSVSIAICIYFILYMRVGMYIAPINGIGKVKLQLIVNLIISILNIFVVIFFGLRFGLIGIISGNILMLIPHVIINPIQLKKLLNGNSKGIWIA